MINSIDKVDEWLRALGLVNITNLEAQFVVKEIGLEVADELKCELFNLFLNILEVRLNYTKTCSFSQSDLEYLSKIEGCESKDFSSFLKKVYVAGVIRKSTIC